MRGLLPEAFRVLEGLGYGLGDRGADPDPSLGLVIGDPQAEGGHIGPVVNKAQFDKIQDLIQSAIDEGATLVTGGTGRPDGRNSGYYVKPTLFADVTPSMRIWREETFGPVAAVVKFTSEEEALAAANDTDFGLAAYFYSRDIGRVWRVAEKLEYGMVGINTGIISNEVAPFGGVKQSGLGREGGAEGIEEYSTVQYIGIADPYADK